MKITDANTHRFIKVFFALLLILISIAPATSFSKEKGSAKKGAKNLKTGQGETKKKDTKNNGHKKVKGIVEDIDFDKGIITIRDKKMNIYHLEMQGSKWVDEKGEKIDRKNIKKGEKIAVDYDVMNEGKLEAVEIKKKHGTGQ
ncbi:MAG: hypothetical protein HZA77_00280 [Candidatus Schekmanbacteria bacterium]|nr:hypothetical protein [Candidatus Schekmanbacteria bacterium]